MRISDIKQSSSLLLTLIFLLVIIPLICISFYNNPSTDDYHYALRDISSNILTANIDTYINWSGRYFATFISAINPLVFHSLLLYKIYPIIMLLLFFGALWYLAKSTKLTTYRERISLAILLFLLYIVQCPSISQSFYWFSGYAAYTVPSILFICLLANLLRAKTIVTTSINLLLIIAIAGSNEISTVILLCTLLYINLEYWISQNRQVSSYLLTLLIVAVVCALVVILSPGNSVRMMDEANSNNLLWTIMISTMQTIGWFFVWGPVLLIGSIIYITLFGEKLALHYRNKPNSCFSISIKRFIIFFFVTLFLAHIPPTWGIGTVAIGRLANVIYLFFILSWFYATQWWINHHLDVFTMLKNKYYSILYGIVFILFLFTILFHPAGVISTAYMDLALGKAYRYNQELINRYHILQNNLGSDNDILIIDNLENIPYTIYFADITTDTDCWQNETYANYWGCNSKIKLVKESSFPDSNLEQLKNTIKSIRKNKFDRK